MAIAKGTLGPINRGESDAYTDFEFTDYDYTPRVGISACSSTTRDINTAYDASNTYASGSDLVFTTATFTGGKPQ